jgi:hypothetical protein
VVVTRVGVAGVLAVFAAGGWLVAAPFALGYQTAGTGWTGATKTDVITGGVLAAAGFIGIFAVIAGQVGELYRAGPDPGVRLYADARSAASLAGTADRGIPGS